MKKYKYILFDADNTLFDFDRCEREAFGEAVGMAGLEFTDEVYSAYHVINESLWKLLEKGGIERAALKIERYRRLFEKFGVEGDGYLSVSKNYEIYLGNKVYEIPGVYDLLGRLSGKYGIYVVTNGLTSVQTSRFAKSRIRERVLDVFISEQVGYAKPDKKYFDAVLDAIGATADECIVVGDSLTSDIDGAINSGIDCIWYNRKGEDAAGRSPTYTITDISETESIL